MQLFAHIQSVSAHFSGFSNDEVDRLAAHMSVMSFHMGQTIMQEGEQGSWFGVLLRGTVTVQLSDGEVDRLPGDILGEMAIFDPGAKRGATIVGKKGGLIASFLGEELEELMVAEPEMGSKLMRLLAKAAVGKSMDGVRRQATRRLPPSIPWPIQLPDRDGVVTIERPTGSDLALEAAAADTARQGARLLRHLLLENG